jgi:hypothetical protein
MAPGLARVRAHKGIGPKGRRLCKLHADLVVIEFDGLDVLVAADRRCDVRRVGGV